MSVGLEMGMVLEYAEIHLSHKCDLLQIDSAIHLGFRLVRLTISKQPHPPRFPPNPPTSRRIVDLSTYPKTLNLSA